MDTYEIKRFYAPGVGKENEVMQTGLTLEEAQDHCQSDDSKCSEWFEGFQKEE